MPYYVGAQRPLPRGKRGRCVASLKMLDKFERKVLASGLRPQVQVEKFGIFVIKTWECPICHLNIWIEQKDEILRHNCLAPQSGAYTSPTMTTSGKKFPKKMFVRSYKELLK